MTRKIIQIVKSDVEGMVALADDGTTWRWMTHAEVWAPVWGPLPQDADGEFAEVEPAPTQASWLPWQHSRDRMWCMDAADESVTEMRGPAQFVRWCGIATWTMVRAYNEWGALSVWRQRDIASETNTEALNVDGKTYAYIESAIPF